MKKSRKMYFFGLSFPARRAKFCSNITPPGCSLVVLVMVIFIIILLF